MQFISKCIFDNIVRDLKSELGINTISLVVNDDQYFKRGPSYSTVTISCGKGDAAWDTVAKVRVSKTMRSFQKNYDAECVISLGLMGVPRIKLNY